MPKKRRAKKQNLWGYLKIGFKLFLIGLLNGVLWFGIKFLSIFLTTVILVLSPLVGVGLAIFQLILFIPFALILNGYIFWRLRKWLFK